MEFIIGYVIANIILAMLAGAIKLFAYNRNDTNNYMLVVWVITTILLILGFVVVIHAAWWVGVICAIANAVWTLFLGNARRNS